MARTKQTARKSTAQKVPRSNWFAHKIARMSAPVTTGGKTSQIQTWSSCFERLKISKTTDLLIRKLPFQKD